MNSQDLHNLQEAYSQVYNEGRVAWDDKKNPNPSGYTPKEKSEAKRRQLGVDDPNKPSFEKGGPGEKEYARYGNLAATQEKMKKRSNQPKGKSHQFKKNPFWKKTSGQVKRNLFGTDVPKDKIKSYEGTIKNKQPFSKEETEYGIYDIILSHLLDEGYAETQEQAEVIMVNMSEEWRESIILEQTLPSNYTDYKSPAVQASHARSMGSASRMRQMDMNATSVDPKDDAQSNLDAVKSGSGVAKPLSGTSIRSGAGKGFKVGDPGINIRPNN
jgi:hypothetical protein